MRIASLTQSYPPMVSGAAIIAAGLAKNMAARGHNSLVIAASDTGAKYVSHEDGVRVVRLPSLKNPKRANQYFSLNPPDVIVAELKPFQPDIIHIHDILWMGVFAIRYGRTNNTPVMASIHQLPWFVSAYLPAFPGLKPTVEWSLWQYSRWLNEGCVCMTVPTQTIAQTIKKCSGIKTKVISYGIDLNRFKPQASNPNEFQEQNHKLKLDPQKPIILHVGRLDLDKRVDVIVKAAAIAMERCDAQLLVVGDGECRQDLIELANQHGIGSRCHFPGFLDRTHDLPSVYRMSTVFTTASEIETQGLVLLEALASGLPVVAVEATCVPEVVKNNTNGYLLQPGDVQGFADKLVEVICDPARSRRFGVAGRLLAQEHSIENTFDKFEDLYASVVNAFMENKIVKNVSLQMN